MNDEIAELRAEIAELKKRVRTNEDYREIANLQAAYGYYVDKGLWDKAAELFAKDGTLEIAGRGVYKGRERVRAYLHH
ncbi:MAG TPA: nuclear transport factor 2 family protein, partial [Alteraurantiacibacter sp.]